MANPQVEQIRQLLLANPLATPGMPLDQVRANLDAMPQLYPPLPGLIRAAAPTGGVRAEWLRPSEHAADRALFYLHGGGYMIGSIDSHADLVGRIAIAAKAPALAIDYRRAPEHPFPAALDDALYAYRWLLRSGVAPSKIAVVGDSAGGGLGLALTFALEQHERPAALALMSPWVDLGCESESLATADDPILKREVVMGMAAAYLAGQDPRTPLASPLYADLSLLPPTLVQAGAVEGLRDDAVRFAARARELGADVTLELWDDMFHAFQMFAVMLEDAERAITRIGEFVRTRTS